MRAGQVIIGCGDVGRRLASLLKSGAERAAPVIVTVRSEQGRKMAAEMGLQVHTVDLDKDPDEPHYCQDAEVFYLVPPQKSGDSDQRSQRLIRSLSAAVILPRKLVVISTTGVYGDCAGEWVTEASPVKPATDRAKRRLDSERQWLRWGSRNNVAVVILRVPGIYAFSRIPRQRLMRHLPVVRSNECGYTNRIHADDLAAIMLAAMQNGQAGEIYNVSDGVPGKVSEYLQSAARILGTPALPEISLAEAKDVLSAGMLSYLAESRKVSNRKMLDQLQVALRYPDFHEGLKHG